MSSVDQQRISQNIKWGLKNGATTAPPTPNDFDNYTDYKRALIDWKSITEDQTRERKANEGKLTFDQSLELQKFKQNQNNSLATINQNKERFAYDKTVNNRNYLQKIAEKERDNNYQLATVKNALGESEFNPDLFTKLQETSQKKLSSMGYNNQETTNSSQILDIFQNESPERQAELLNKYKSFKASKTNEWGDDLTNDAPKATTTYQDGNHTWSYPGVKDSKTGEVRGSLSITSPYGSEEEYQNKGGVVGQNPDGSWIWDKNVKSGSGGGFFQRGGLSDLGHALAGDAPRQVPITQSTRPLLDQDKYLQRIGRSNKQQIQDPGEWNGLPESVKENLRRSEERQKLFAQPEVKNNEISTNETMSQELRRLQQSGRTPTGAPIAEAQSVSKEQMNSLNPYKNGVITKFRDTRRNLNEKYKTRSLKDYVTNLFEDPKPGVLSDEDYTRITDRLNNQMSNWSR